MESQMRLGNGLFAIYDCAENRFQGSDALLEAFETESVGQCFEMLPEKEQGRMEDILASMASATEPTVYHTDFCFQDAKGNDMPCRVGFVCGEPGKYIVLTFQANRSSAPQGFYEDGTDKLTGLMTRERFLDRLNAILDKRESGGGAVVYFDMQRFKIINNMFGMPEGDRLLLHIADRLREAVGEYGFACRLNADRFVFYVSYGEAEVGQCVEKLFDGISAFELPFDILCNAGVYMVSGDRVPANAAVDFAIIAQRVVKGSFTESIHYYREELRANLLGEQEVTGMMRTALRTGQFAVYYQPQYNHSAGMIVGAEALVRWIHPEKGLIPPVQFISVFENNGFISHLDQYVFEQVCAFQRRQLDKKVELVPISVNLTRYDIFVPNFLETLETIRQKYDVPAQYIRIEITESSALGNSHFINNALRILHGYGYVVEMDDFGSGYSSLNILKDIDFDMIKLDMRFFREERKSGQGGRGGIILSSVVRMVNWLQLPMIAEGVETMEQADFLRSIGCDYIQGYLYSKPLPGREFERLLGDSPVGKTAPDMRLIETMDADRFWSSESLETLIFSNYVGGAAIFEYKNGKAEVLRVNKKYLQELGMNLTEKDIVNKSLSDFLGKSDQTLYINMLEKAIKTGEEQECETWRNICSSSCGEEQICIRSTIRLIGHGKDHYIFYAMIRNITAEKRRFTEILDSERRFKAASEQINIYYWEYTVATREMRPCFRCMRDLGLPALMTNYPDSAIEMGVFPPEVADMYRDWHRQIAEGVPSLEAVMPLTVGRVPFHVRYTTEFDESGKPVKAYGSAALVVD